MWSMSTKPYCANCKQEIFILKCRSCWQTDGNNQSEVQEILPAQTNKARQRHALIQQVDEWESNAINQIRQTAEEARQLIIKHTTDCISQVQTQLVQLSEQLRQSLEESSFIASNVSKWQKELVQLSQQLKTPSIITVRQVSAPLVNKILVELSEVSYIPNIPSNAKWAQNGITVAGGNEQGNGLNQLNGPIGVYIDDDQTIYIADYSNHRVVEWKRDATSGQVVAGSNGQEHQSIQLSYPAVVLTDRESDSLIICEYNKRVMRWSRRNRTAEEVILSGADSYGFAMDIRGYLYVSDYTKHEVKRWKIGETNGTVVAGGNGSGARLDQLSNPTNIFVDQDCSVYVSDRGNHRVVKWIEGAKEGIVVAGGQGGGNALTQLSNPWAVVVDQLGTVYVADDSNNRIMRWTKGATQGTIIAGGNGSGAQSNQFNRCLHLSFDNQGNLFVTDHNNHRIQKFNIDLKSIQ